MHEIETRKVEVKVEDGTTMTVFVASPLRVESAPGMIVLQEAFGVNSHIRNVACRLAREGYFAAAPELFHRTGPGFESAYQFSEALPHFQAVTQTTLELDLRATHNWLRTQPNTFSDRIGAIGFCMGGRAAFLANATLPLKAAVSYYGGGITPALLPLAEKQAGPILLLWGGKDTHIPAEQRRAVTDALTQSKKSFVNVEFADADHGFFCDERAAYHEVSAREAWGLTLRFLKDHVSR